MTICSPLEVNDGSKPLADAYHISFRSSQQLVLDKIFDELLLLQDANGAPVRLRTPPLYKLVVFGSVYTSYSATRRFGLEVEKVSRPNSKRVDPRLPS